MTWSRGSVVGVVAIVVAALMMALPVATQGQAREPFRLPDPPVRGDCRNYPEQACTWDAWTGEVTVSPKLVRAGEKVAVSVSICCGAVGFSMPLSDGCTATVETLDREVLVDGVWVVQPTEVTTATSCSLTTGGGSDGWHYISAGITGPCGSNIAVQEGRAEFAACGSATDSDYYGVIPEDEDLYAISGRVATRDHRRLGGVLVELSGDERQAYVTRGSGDYAFLVPEGAYTVTTETGLCAVVDGVRGEGCHSSASVTVPGSHAVDFEPEREGTISGTIHDSEGNPFGGRVTISAMGKQGAQTTPDQDGHYTMTVVAGSYLVTAAATDYRAGNPAASEPPVVRTVYCSEVGTACDTRVRVEVDGDEVVDWHDRGLISTAEVEPMPEEPREQPGAADLDLWFLASVLAGAGVVIGAGAAAGGGGGGGGSAPPPRPWDEMTKEEQERYRSAFIERWKQAHPDHSAQQLVNLIELLHQQPSGFWDRSIQMAIDMGWAYGQDVASGEQIEGLGYTLEGFGERLVERGKDLRDFGAQLGSEAGQLPATLAEFPRVFGEDLESGEMRDRLAGMLEYGGTALDTAAEFWSDPEKAKAAIEQYGQESYDAFMRKVQQLDKAMMSKDPIAIRAAIGEIAADAEIEAILGAATDKGTGKLVGYLADIKAAKQMEAGLDGMRLAASEARVEGATAELLARREELLTRAASGERVPLSHDEVAELFGIDRGLTLERQATILQYSEGAADEGVSTVYKVGRDAESSIVARQLREQYPELYTSKVNQVPDKGFKPGEEAFMSTEDLARLERSGLKPGETINYTPRELTLAERDALSPELREVYDARRAQAGTWDAYEGYANRKTVDMTDPANLERYGPTWVRDDPGNPATSVEVWKDPVDGRIYMRAQKTDGTWTKPTVQVTDVDTVTHSGGGGLTYEQSADLQARQSFGQLSEGDTPMWGMRMVEQAPDGSFRMKDTADQAMLLKAIDQLRTAEQQPVIKQALDGLYLECERFPQLDHLTEAARSVSTWTREQQALLQGWGVLP